MVKRRATHLTPTVSPSTKNSTAGRDQRGIPWGRMRGDNALCSSAALINSEYPAKFVGNFAMTRRRGAEGSNPLCSTIQSLGFRTRRRIARNQRVCARFELADGTREGLLLHQSLEFAKPIRAGFGWFHPRASGIRLVYSNRDLSIPSRTMV